MNSKLRHICCHVSGEAAGRLSSGRVLNIHWSQTLGPNHIFWFCDFPSAPQWGWHLWLTFQWNVIKPVNSVPLILKHNYSHFNINHHNLADPYFFHLEQSSGPLISFIIKYLHIRHNLTVFSATNSKANRELRTLYLLNIHVSIDP